MRNLAKLRRWWLAGGLALLLVGGIAILLCFQPWRPRGPFYDKYQRVQFGMTKEEVVTILGSPIYEEFPGGSMGPAQYYWLDGEQGICVDVSEDKVSDKSFRRARASDWVR
jgi:hypothetical protein